MLAIGSTSRSISIASRGRLQKFNARAITRDPATDKRTAEPPMRFLVQRMVKWPANRLSALFAVSSVLLREDQDIARLSEIESLDFSLSRRIGQRKEYGRSIHVWVERPYISDFTSSGRMEYAHSLSLVSPLYTKGPARRLLLRGSRKEVQRPQRWP